MSPTRRQVPGAFPVPQTLFPLFLDRTLFPPFLDRRQHCDRETRGTCLRVGVGGVRFRLNRVRGAICVSSRETLHNSGHQTSIQNATQILSQLWVQSPHLMSSHPNPTIFVFGCILLCRSPLWFLARCHLLLPNITWKYFQYYRNRGNGYVKCILCFNLFAIGTVI